MTPAGIEPATFRFVAQHLNHCAFHGTSIIAIPLTLIRKVYSLPSVKFYGTNVQTELFPHLFDRISAIYDNKYGKQGYKFVYAPKYLVAFTVLIFTQITITLHICVRFFFYPISSKPGNTVESRVRFYLRRYAITVNTVTLHADFLYRISHKYVKKC